MKVNSQLCNEIKAAGTDAGNDISAKSLLKYSKILARILKGCVKEYENISLKDIETKYIQREEFIENREIHGYENKEESNTEQPEKITGMNTENAERNEGKVFFDLIFYAYLPGEKELTKFIVNIEPQNDFHPGYPLVKRGFYYDARLISGQYGTEFTGTNYGDIKKVISIWICLNPAVKCMNTINRYRITEENVIGEMRLKSSDYDVMEVIMICLHKDANGRKSSELIDMLSLLFSGEIDGENKIKKLEEEYRLEMEYEYREVFSKMCNLSEVYTEQGYRSGVEDGIEIGVERGIDIGVERGIGIGMEIGEDKGKLKMLKSLVDNGTISLKTAAENAQMTVEEFEEKIRNIDK